MIPFRMCTLALAVSLGVASNEAAADEVGRLSQWLPQGANATAVVRVREILRTPRAREEGWNEKAEQDFLSGAISIPPWVDVLLVGALVHPAVPEAVWTAGVVTLPDEVTMEQIAQHEGSPLETLAGKAAVRAHRDAYFVEIRPNTMGVLRPAHRQDAARWVRSLDEGGTEVLGEYLAGAVAEDAHIVLAMDLQEMLSPTRVREYVDAQADRIQDAGQRAELCDLIDTVRGITFTASVDNPNQAQISIAFGKAAGTMGPSVKLILLELLGDMGAALEDFDNCGVDTDGTSVLLTAEISDEHLRRVLSLIISPAPSARVKRSAPPEPAEPSAPPESATSPRVDVDASKKYLRSVVRIIDDLKRASRRAKEPSQTATWYENFARKIDDLPVNGIDPELVEYAGSVSPKLRSVATSLRGQAVNVDAARKALTYEQEYQPPAAALSIWGGVGYRPPSYQVNSNLQEVREHNAAAVAAGATERQQIWQMINDERAEIERRMRLKYGDDFARPR